MNFEVGKAYKSWRGDKLTFVGHSKDEKGAVVYAIFSDHAGCPVIRLPRGAVGEGCTSPYDISGPWPVTHKERVYLYEGEATGEHYTTARKINTTMRLLAVKEVEFTEGEGLPE